MIRVGETPLLDERVGQTAVEKVMVGAEQVWGEDTATRVSIVLTETTTIELCYVQSEERGVLVDWGDGSAVTSDTGTEYDGEIHAYQSHEYAAGSYELVIDTLPGATWQAGGRNYGEGISGYNFTLFGRSMIYISGTAVRAITFGASCVALRQRAICGEHGLTSVSVPDTVVSVGTSAFAGCKYLESARLPSHLTSIPGYVFEDCDSLRAVTIPSGVTSIGDFAFEHCALESVNIPSGVTSIGKDAFFGCSQLSEIALPNSVTSIGNYAFGYCSGIESFTIPPNITTVPACMLAHCTGLKTVYIPAGVTSIGSDAFDNCPALTAFTVGNGNTAFTVDGGALFNAGKTELLRAVSTTTTLPATTTRIGDYAFSGHPMQSYSVPSTVTAIGAHAFADCPNLTGIEIGDQVDTIGTGAFLGCSSLVRVALPLAVTTLTTTFQNCTSLAAIWIRRNVSSIPAGANTSSLVMGCPSTCRIYVEAASKPSGWGTYWNNYRGSNVLQVTWGQTTKPW